MDHFPASVAGEIGWSLAVQDIVDVQQLFRLIRDHLRRDGIQTVEIEEQNHSHDRQNDQSPARDSN